MSSDGLLEIFTLGMHLFIKQGRRAWNLVILYFTFDWPRTDTAVVTCFTILMHNPNAGNYVFQQGTMNMA